MSNIDQPMHYQGKTYSVIDVIEDFGLNFNLGNALKYILRAGRKGDAIEDFEKAMWYIDRERTNVHRKRQSQDEGQDHV